MTLDLLPRKLASLEAPKRAVKAALEADLAPALAYVGEREAATGGLLLPLPVPDPRNIRLITARDYATITAWPTITIENAGMDARNESEQAATTQGEGSLALICWLQHPRADELDLMLERYGAAVWLVLLNHEPFAGCDLVRDSRRIQADPTGGTTHRRYVLVGCDLHLWGR